MGSWVNMVTATCVPVELKDNGFTGNVVTHIIIGIQVLLMMFRSDNFTIAVIYISI